MGSQRPHRPPRRIRFPRDPGHIRTLKMLPRIEITWSDAASSSGSWTPLDELRQQRSDGLMEGQTIGYLVKMGKTAVMVCQTRAENGKLANDWSIPRKWIKRVRVFK